MPGRPVLIGEETAGSTGAPLVIELPHEACARLCTLRALYPYSMKPFVNQGILPDIEAKPTVDEYIKGIDVAMLKAIDILNKY
jgi:C-terminal processing protease CtpA/Prc